MKFKSLILAGLVFSAITPSLMFAQDAVSIDIPASAYHPTPVMGNSGTIDVPTGNSKLTCSVSNPYQWILTDCQTIYLLLPEGQIEVHSACPDHAPPLPMKSIATATFLSVQQPMQVIIKTQALLCAARFGEPVATTINCKVTPM